MRIADPVRAAVDRAVEAALAAGRVDARPSPRRGRGCGFVGSTAIRPIIAGVREPDVRPGGAAVGRLVDPVADVRDAAAGGVRLAGAGPERAVGAARERADRLRVVVRPGRRVGHAGVGALPDAAARRGDVDRVGLRRVDDDVGDAAADVVGADVLPRAAGRGDRSGLCGCAAADGEAEGLAAAERAGGLVVRHLAGLLGLACGRDGRLPRPGALSGRAAERGDERDQRQGRERHHHGPSHRQSTPARRFPSPSHHGSPFSPAGAATLKRPGGDVQSAPRAQAPLVADAEGETVRVVALEQQLRGASRNADGIAEAGEGDRRERLQRLEPALVEGGRDRVARRRRASASRGPRGSPRGSGRRRAPGPRPRAWPRAPRAAPAWSPSFGAAPGA